MISSGSGNLTSLQSGSTSFGATYDAENRQAGTTGAPLQVILPETVSLMPAPVASMTTPSLNAISHNQAQHPAGPLCNWSCHRRGDCDSWSLHILDASALVENSKSGGVSAKGQRSSASPGRTSGQRQRGAEGPAAKKLVEPAVRREAVRYAVRQHQLSQRRGCRLIGMSRSVCRYQSHRPADTKMREKVREIARKRQRFGHLRITVLRRQGQRVNHKRIHRICREERLLVPRWRRKRLQRQSVPGSQAATRRNHRWAMDFAQDGLSNGRVFAHHDGGRHLRARGTLTSSPLFFTVWILPEQTNSASWWIESDNSRSRSRLHPSMSHSTTRSPYRHLVMDSWLEWHMSR